MSGHRALLTGATGFIGSHLAARLGKSGWEVHALVRESKAARVAGRFQEHRYDGSTGSVVQAIGAARPDVVFHLASLFIAEHRTDDLTPLVESNVLLGAQLAEGMRVHGRTRLVNTGTAWQHYGDAEYDPASLYAATKQALVDVLRFFEEAAALRVITLELFESYGPSDPRPKLMSALGRASRAGARVALTDGRQVLELVHVRDIVRAYEIAAERLLEGLVERHETYAVRSGAAVTVRELVETFGRVAGKPIAADWGARSYRAREMLAAPTGGATLPGWKAEISLQEGIRELLKGD